MRNLSVKARKMVKLNKILNKHSRMALPGVRTIETEKDFWIQLIESIACAKVEVEGQVRLML